MKIIFVFFIGLFSMFFSFQNTLGCQCGAVGPICSQFSRADAVFVGRVEKVDLLKSPKELSYSMIHFNVEQSFKGITETTVKVGYEFGTSCSKSPDAFKPGEKWLVYGYKDEELLIIPFCTGSHQISSRSDDLEFIENLLKGKTKEFVFGRLVKDRYDEIKNG